MARGPPVYVPDLHNATPGRKTPKLSFHECIRIDMSARRAQKGVRLHK